MRRLSNREKLDIALELLSETELEEFENKCEKLEHEDEQEEWPNIPAECENTECANCSLECSERQKRDCPYQEKLAQVKLLSPLIKSKDWDHVDKNIHMLFASNSQFQNTKTTGVYETVKCLVCDKEFETNPPEHAFS